MDREKLRTTTAVWKPSVFPGPSRKETFLDSSTLNPDDVLATPITVMVQ